MRRVLLFVVAVMVWPAAPAVAQSAGDPLVCAAIEADVDRLACYDAVFRQPSDLPPGTAVAIESKQLIPARPTGRGRATMTVDCTTGVLDVRFSFAGQLLTETGDEAPISFQVQQAGAFIRNLPVSDDNQSISFATTAQAEAFLESIEGGGSLMVRITPPRQRSIQAEFDLRPHADAIAAARQACR